MAKDTSQAWIEVAVMTPCHLENPVSHVLRRLTGSSVRQEIRGQKGIFLVKGVVSGDGQINPRLLEIEEAFRQVEKNYDLSEPLGVDLRVLGHSDGTACQQDKPQPVRVCSRLIVAPLYERVRADPGQIVLRIEPGQAFGDGSHPSTRLALRLLDGLVSGRYGPSPERDNWVLDAGCGSGVLALAAAGLGGYKVLAVDISREAISAALGNLELNQLPGSNVHLVLGDLSCFRAPFSMVLANLAPSVHECAHHALCGAIAAGGWIILSGFYETQKDMIIKPYVHNQAKEKACLLDDGWAGILLYKEGRSEVRGQRSEVRADNQ
jgi:ribosomal protein L11 methyltransferase